MRIEAVASRVAKRQLKLLNEEAMRKKAKELEMLEVNLGIWKDLHRLRRRPSLPVR
jgi:hypothetical protein